METVAVIPFADFGRSVVSLMFDSGPFAKFVLFTLFISSVACWAIIWDRSRLYRRLKAGGHKLQKEVSSRGLALSTSTIKQSMPSVEGALLLEAKRYVDGARSAGDAGAGSGPNPDRLRGLLEGRAMTEVSEMEKYLIFLATTAGVAPFLGLLGTVWGIMGSFVSMGAQGTASIEVVGPGIAEALITTIAGLGTAIPALVGYNLLVRYVHREEARIDFFIKRVVELSEAGRPAPRKAVEREATYEERPI